MGLIVSTIDEAGLNELFVKAFNATPDQGFGAARTAGNSQLQMQLSINGRLRAMDFATGARPADLRGSALNPPVAYGGVRLHAEAELRAMLNVAGWSRGVTLPVNADVVLAGAARIGVEQQPQLWLARLELDAAGTRIAFDGNRDALVGAVRHSLAGIDTSPLPGRQGLPAGLVNAAADLAGQLFDTTAGAAGQAATTAAPALIGNTRIAVGYPEPRRSRLAVPGGGGGEVEVEVTQLAVAIGASTATLTASFA